MIRDALVDRKSYLSMKLALYFCFVKDVSWLKPTSYYNNRRSHKIIVENTPQILRFLHLYVKLDTNFSPFCCEFAYRILAVDSTVCF